MKPLPPAPPGHFKNGTPIPAPGEPVSPHREPESTKAPPLKRHRNCAVCNHAERVRIEALHVAGNGIDKLAEQFGIHRDAIWRHMTRHVSEETKVGYLLGKAKIADLANAAADESRAIIDYLAIIRSILMNQLDRESQANRPYGVERVAGRLIEVLREMGSITGEVSKIAGVTLNITNNTQILSSPPFLQLQAGLLSICQAHPKARADIVALFRDLDAKHATNDPKLIEHEAAE
jgi:hypothetical protein